MLLFYYTQQAVSVCNMHGTGIIKGIIIIIGCFCVSLDPHKSL